MTAPFGPLHAELPFAEIHIAPFERDHLAAPQPGFTSQEHDEIRVRFGYSGLAFGITLATLGSGT